MNEEEREIAYKNGMSFGEEQQLYWKKDDYKTRCDKAVEYIKENCLISDSWEDLDFCNFVPIGKITYKALSKSKVKELLNILNGKE